MLCQHGRHQSHRTLLVFHSHTLWKKKKQWVDIALGQVPFVFPFSTPVVFGGAHGGVDSRLRDGGGSGPLYLVSAFG